MPKVIVYHRYYGCDTGCCGHVVEIFEDDVVASEDFHPYDDGDGRNFHFDHPPYSTLDDDAACLTWAKKFVRENLGEEHVADLDWDHCVVLDD